LNDIKVTLHFFKQRFKITSFSYHVLLVTGYYEYKICRLCTKKNKDKIDNIWKLSVRHDGSYHCFRCDESNNWTSLQTKLLSLNSPLASQLLQRNTILSPSNSNENRLVQTSKPTLPDQEKAASYTRGMLIS
jgi:hypothetical protein